MEKISGLTINEAEYDLPENGKGKIAVLIYSGEADPKKVLDYAVEKYVENNAYYELIDAHLDNPWMRVILSDINNMSQTEFNLNQHKLNLQAH
jgi:uncharacterized protein YozE (UPF0346 family)